MTEHTQNIRLTAQSSHCTTENMSRKRVHSSVELSDQVCFVKSFLVRAWGNVICPKITDVYLQACCEEFRHSEEESVQRLQEESFELPENNTILTALCWYKRRLLLSRPDEPICETEIGGRYSAYCELTSRFLEKNELVIDWVKRFTSCLHLSDTDLKETIDRFLKGEIMFATPILCLGRKSDSSLPYSCYLIDFEDDESWQKMCLLQSSGGGIGGYLYQKYRSTIKKKAARQPCGRNATFNMYTHVFDSQVIDILEERNDASKTMATPCFFWTIILSDDFLTAVKEKKKWTLYKNASNLFEKLFYESHYSEVKQALHELAENGRLQRKEINAKELYDKIVSCIGKTGTPNIVHFENLNNFSVYRDKTPSIHSGNLCCEIFQVHSEGNFSACCLSSLNLASFFRTTRDNTTLFDWESLKTCTKLIVRALTSIQKHYPIEGDTDHNIGIGTNGLFELLLLNGFEWGSSEALRLDYMTHKCIWVSAVEQSKELYEHDIDTEKSVLSACYYYKDSPIADVLTIDEICQNSTKRKHLQLTASMPTATCSKLLKSTSEGINPHFVWQRGKNSKGSFSEWSFGYIHWCRRHGKTPDKNFFSPHTRPLNQLLHAKVRSPWIDQGQSMNLFGTRDQISEQLMEGARMGLKTLCYYFYRNNSWSSFLQCTSCAL